MLKNKTKKGITLISLVITIILLLILAMVAISLAVDSDGLFSKAGDAANKWNSSVAAEGSTLENLMIMANSIGGTQTPPPSSLPAGWNSDAVVDTVEEGDRIAPIPSGFVASEVDGEDTISGGLVIYETDTPVTDENHETAITQYNQYVWIPVNNINDMIMCQTHGASVTLNTITLQCPTCGTATKLAGRLYTANITYTIDDAGNEIHTYNMDFTQADQTYDANTGYREPAVVTYYDEATDNYHELGTAEAFLEQLQSDFDNMAASVAKYKGFYITRYEVGANGESKKGQTVLTDAADSGNMWYGLYNTLRKTGTRTTSQMIWGCEYDQVIKFIGDEAEIGHTDRNLASEPAVSGNNSDDEMQNIFDLEGNYREWTAEADNTYGRVYRGRYVFFS